MIEQRIDAVIENINELHEMYSRHEQDMADEVATKTEEIAEKERENRDIQNKCNMLELGARNHEKENARTMFAGLIVGAVLGVVFATIF